MTNQQNNKKTLIDIYDELQNTKYCILERLKDVSILEKERIKLSESLEKTEKLLEKLINCSKYEDYERFFILYDIYWEEEMNE